MEEKPTTEEVSLAVNCLYNNPNQAEKDKASLWLKQLQKSIFAWTIADELLHLKENPELCYFGAQTLRKKIQSCFWELLLEVHASLRDSLMEHVKNINQDTSTEIVSQLCLALAGLLLNMTDWKDSVMHVIRTFSQTHTWVLLEILTVLPAELNFHSNRLGQNRRSQFVKKMVDASLTVKEFLTFYSYNVSVSINVKVVKCFTSWISVSTHFSSDIVSNEVLFKVFRILNDGKITGELNDVCTEFVCELAKCLTTANDSHDFVLEGFLLNNISHLEDSFRRSTAETDPGKSLNYCRIFVEVAIGLIPEMIRKDTEYYYGRLLNLLIVCVKHNNSRFAEMTFKFWYALSYKVALDDLKSSCDSFVPYVDRLFAVLFQHCHMAANHEDLLEERNDLYQFRKSASEVMYDLCFIVKDSNWFCHLAENLISPEAAWNTIEASLFIMQTVSKTLDTADDQIVMRVVELVMILEENVHVAIKHSSILLLGELYEWIDRHPEFLYPILSFFMTSLSNPKLQTAVTKSLKNIFRCCKNHLAQHVPVLLKVLQDVDSFSTDDNRSILDLLRSLARLISFMPEKDIGLNLLEMCALQINPLSQLINSDFAIVEDSKTDPAVWLKQLRCIFEAIEWRLEEDHGQFTTIVVEEVWPILTRTMIKYQCDFRITDQSCMCMDAVLSCFESEMPQLVDPLVTILMSLYEKHQHSGCLYLGNVLVDHYGIDGSCTGILMKMFKQFVNPSLQLLEISDEHPDIVQGFYRLCCRMLKRFPLNFLNSTVFLPVFQKTLLVTSLGNENLNEYVIKFFDNLFVSGQENLELKKLVNNIFLNHGQELMIVLIRACAYTLHSNSIEDVAEVITEMLYFDQEISEKFIKCGLESLQNPNEGEIKKVTAQQFEDIYCSIVSGNIKHVEEALKDLQKLHR